MKDADSRRMAIDQNSQKCPLCLSRADLVSSHILPAAIAKWHIWTSPTGYFASARGQNDRPQTYLKVPLLCGPCDRGFAPAEQWFRWNFFARIQDSTADRIEYGPELLKFLVFTCWKVLQLHLKDADGQDKLALTKAATVWRNYLTGDRGDCGRYEFYVVPLKSLEPALARIVCGSVYQFTRRLAFIGLPRRKGSLALCFTVPGLLVIAGIRPKHFAGLDLFCVKQSGSIPLDQMPTGWDVFHLIISIMCEVHLVHAAGTGERSILIQQRVARAFARDPIHYSRSEGYRALVSDLVTAYYGAAGLEIPECDWLDVPTGHPSADAGTLHATLLTRAGPALTAVKPGRQYELEAVLTEVFSDLLGSADAQDAAPYTRSVRAYLQPHAPPGYRFVVGFAGAVDDHPAMEIELIEESESRCDLCGCRGPALGEIVVPDFSFPSPFGVPYHMQDNYAACGACQQDIQTVDRLHHIVERVMEAMEFSGAFDELPEELRDGARAVMMEHQTLHAGLVHSLRLTS